MIAHAETAVVHAQAQSALPVWAVIVAYNSSADLACCVPPLREAGLRGIVVVDNSDSDAEWSRLVTMFGALPDVHLLRAPGNGGFAAGVNAGVRTLPLADDEFIWLVNPDTVPERESARELVRVARSTGAAIVSPLLTTGPEGDTVWFAGGDLDLRRGVCRHRGQGALVVEHRADDEPNTFVTGAAMLVTAAAWRALNGLDERYFLYWEDADLSWRASRLGLRMVLAPGARVWHRVGGSGTREGMSADYYFYMQRNRAWFQRRALGSRVAPLTTGAVPTLKRCLLPMVRERSGRWVKTWASIRGLVAGLAIAPTTEDRPMGDPHARFDARPDGEDRAPASTPSPAGQGPELLVLSMGVMDQPRDGGSLRSRAMRDSLREAGLWARTTAEPDTEPGSRLTALPSDVRALVLLLRVLSVLLRFPSLSLLKRVSWRVLRRIARFDGGPVARPSLVDTAQMAIYLPACRRPVALALHNVEHELLANYAAAAPTRLRRLAARYESRVMRSFERHLLTLGLPVFVVSEHDRDVLRVLGPDAEIVVAPNGASDDFYRAASRSTGDTVVFVAHLGWQPNVDAARWLVRDVWPLVTRRRPEATLQLVGRSPDRTVLELAGDSVEIHADVDSVVPYVAGARVATAPLLTAGGTRIKIIEALACGKPVVATPLGALGLEQAFSSDVLHVHRDASAFADAVVGLLDESHGASAARCRAQADAFRWSRVLAPMAQRVRERVELSESP